MKREMKTFIAFSIHILALANADQSQPGEITGNAKETVTAPYEGSWVLHNKGKFFDNFLKIMEVGWLARKAAGMISPTVKMTRNSEYVLY